MNEDFEIIGSIDQIELIAVDSGIRKIRRLYKRSDEDVGGS
jgi:hypothetical protein